jgi:hypothetical protein
VLCVAAASLLSSLICIALISAPSNIVDLYSTPLSMTYIAYSGTVATCTLLCDFICICLWGKSSCMLKCIMLLPWATFLHCGASFHDPPYTLLQSNFIALTVVCNILNALSHCNVLSALLWMCSCSSIIVALHRTVGSLSLHYWHHLPWCFLDELVCCGQLRLVNSGTWIGLTHKLFDLFASSTLVTPIVTRFAQPCIHIDAFSVLLSALFLYLLPRVLIWRRTCTSGAGSSLFCALTVK